MKTFINHVKESSGVIAVVAIVAILAIAGFILGGAYKLNSKQIELQNRFSLLMPIFHTPDGKLSPGKCVEFDALFTIYSDSTITIDAYSTVTTLKIKRFEDSHTDMVVSHKGMELHLFKYTDKRPGIPLPRA